MPLASPTSDEAKKTFPEESQRLAVCYRQFGERKDAKAGHPPLAIEATVTFDIEGDQP